MAQLHCDGATDKNGVCPLCAVAHRDSIELYQIIMNHFKDKNLNEFQQIKSSLVAALTCAELISGPKNLLQCAHLVNEIVDSWFVLLADKTSVSAANHINGNGTVN